MSAVDLIDETLVRNSPQPMGWSKALWQINEIDQPNAQAPILWGRTHDGKAVHTSWGTMSDSCMRLDDRLGRVT